MKLRVSYVIAVLIFFFVGFSLYPTYYELTKKNTIRPERQFELVHNFYTDFNFYLSRIRQGLEGNLTVHEKYTSEPHQGSLIQIFYLSLGWVGRWVRVPWHRTGDIYQMARIVLAFTLLFMIAEIAKSGFKRGRWQILAFLLAVTASTYPKLVQVEDGSWRFGGYMAWWSVMDSLQRITFLPHLLAGQAMMAFMMLILADRETMTRPVNWFFLGIFGLILGLVFPPGLLFVYAALPVIIISETFILWKNGTKSQVLRRQLIKRLIPMFIVGALSVPSLVYLQLMTSFYPWKELALQDVLRPLPFEYAEYFRGVGLVLPIGIIGLLLAIRKRESLMILSVAWTVTWLALLFIFKKIPQQSPLRFSEMIPHVPLGILSAYLFQQIAEGKWYRQKFVQPFIKMKKNAVGIKSVIQYSIFIIPIIWLGSNLFHMYSSWLWQRDFVGHKIRAEIPLVPTGSYVMYPLREFLEAMIFIQDNSSRNDVVLAEWNTSNYIPVISGNTVYIGHDNTVNSEEKKLYVRSFFTGQMPAEGARRWLLESGIKFIYFGPLEFEDAAGKQITDFYPFLREIYKNTYVRVYAVE